MSTKFVCYTITSFAVTRFLVALVFCKRLSASLNNSQRNTIRQRCPDGSLYMEIFQRLYLRLYRAIHKHYNLFFKNSSARAKSCGVSIPIVSTSLIPTFILYPFSSQRSCSNDSAISSDDCGSAVISLSTSVR